MHRFASFHMNGEHAWRTSLGGDLITLHRNAFSLYMVVAVEMKITLKQKKIANSAVVVPLFSSISLTWSRFRELIYFFTLPDARPTGRNNALDPVCSLPQETGPCGTALQRWAYDAAERRCVEFIYGGCRGNANNFVSKEACEIRCGGESLTTNFPSFV